MSTLPKWILDRGVSVNVNNVPQGLKTMELTKDQKRAHLYGKGIRGERAEEILDKLYPK